MRTSNEIYASFRKAQSKAFNRPYKLPKDFDAFFLKMRKGDKEALVLATKWFNTKWQNINPDRYFQYGFELLKNRFTYKKFFDPRLVKYYIMRDKSSKRDLRLSKVRLRDSALFVKKWMKLNKEESGVSTLLRYSHSSDDGIPAPVKHYLMGNIDKYFFVWLLYNKYIVLTDSDKALVPLVVERYRDYVGEVEELRPFMEKIEEKL